MTTRSAIPNVTEEQQQVVKPVVVESKEPSEDQ